MAEPLVCPSCRALSPAGAAWCSLCFEPFEAAAPKPPPARPVVESTPASGGPSAGGPPPPPRRPSGPPPPPAAPHRRVEPATGADVETSSPSGATWTCVFCDSVVPVEETSCPVCHQTIYDSFGGGAAQAPVDPATVMRWSAFPGGGHVKVGQGLLGVTIAMLSIISLAFGVVLVFSGRVPWGAAQIFVGIALWAVAVHDAYRYAHNDPGQVMLRPRILSIVAGIWFMILIAAAVSAQGAIQQ